VIFICESFALKICSSVSYNRRRTGEEQKKKIVQAMKKTKNNENNREQISYKYLININLKNLEKLVKV